MSILDRVKALAIKVEAELPQGVQKLTVVVEQKAAAVEAALKNAVPPEVETYLSKIEASIESHTSALAHLFEKHAATPAQPATPAPTSDAIPTSPVL